LQVKREEREAAFQAKLSGIQSMQTKIDSLRDPEAMERAIARYETKYEELEAMRLEEEREADTTARATAEEIHTAVATCTEYLAHVQSQLKRCASELEKKKTAIGSTQFTV
jgi:tRNA(Phe) wybutosine-synthesizing methylase Tyw3